MKVAIVGSRNYPDLELVRAVVRALPRDTTVISGGARGVDTVAVHTARECGLLTIIHLPRWELYGRRAGPIRNELIVDQADEVLAFWNGSSPGTKNAIKLAQTQNKLVSVY